MPNAPGSTLYHRRTEAQLVREVIEGLYGASRPYRLYNNLGKTQRSLKLDPSSLPLQERDIYSMDGFADRISEELALRGLRDFKVAVKNCTSHERGHTFQYRAINIILPLRAIHK